MLAACSTSCPSSTASPGQVPSAPPSRRPDPLLPACNVAFASLTPHCVASVTPHTKTAYTHKQLIQTHSGTHDYTLTYTTPNSALRWLCRCCVAIALVRWGCVEGSTKHAHHTVPHEHGRTHKHHSGTHACALTPQTNSLYKHTVVHATTQSHTPRPIVHYAHAHTLCTRTYTLCLCCCAVGAGTGGPAEAGQGQVGGGGGGWRLGGLFGGGGGGAASAADSSPHRRCAHSHSHPYACARTHHPARPSSCTHNHMHSHTLKRKHQHHVGYWLSFIGGGDAAVVDSNAPARCSHTHSTPDRRLTPAHYVCERDALATSSLIGGLTWVK